MRNGARNKSNAGLGIGIVGAATGSAGIVPVAIADKKGAGVSVVPGPVSTLAGTF